MALELECSFGSGRLRSLVLPTAGVVGYMAAGGAALATCVDVDGVEATTFEFKGVGASAGGGRTFPAFVFSTTDEGAAAAIACCLGAGVVRALLLPKDRRPLLVLLVLGPEVELGNPSMVVDLMEMVSIVPSYYRALSF